MAQVTKRNKAIRVKVEHNKLYPVADALKLVKEAIEDPKRLVLDL